MRLNPPPGPTRIVIGWVHPQRPDPALLAGSVRPVLPAVIVKIWCRTLISVDGFCDKTGVFQS